MEHIKNHHSAIVKTTCGEVIVEGPVVASKIAEYQFSGELKAFQKPHIQHQALKEIAELPEGRIILARTAGSIIGYATFLYPDPLERWAEQNMEELLELGAIEIDRNYRRNALAEKILQVAFMDDFMENYIVLTTEYYWHWDLKGLGLDVWEYRTIMEKVMAAGGLECFATDDEEITAHPANCLMARIGKNVVLESIEKFNKLRFKYRFMV